LLEFVGSGDTDDSGANDGNFHSQGVLEYLGFEGCDHTL
jgi:hypothetical protein